MMMAVNHMIVLGFCIGCALRGVELRARFRPCRREAHDARIFELLTLSFRHDK